MVIVLGNADEGEYVVGLFDKHLHRRVTTDEGETMRKVVTLLALIGTLGIHSAVLGQEKEPNSNVSITLSTLNLARPVLTDDQTRYNPAVELMGEFNLADKFGVAAIGNVGTAELRQIASGYNFTSVKFGIQGAYYPVGHFGKGMQLGLQAMRTQVFGEDSPEDYVVTAAANATSVAAFVGYKVIAGPGFTFVGQLGAGPRFLTASAASGGNSATVSELRPKIVLNLNVGWSL